MASTYPTSAQELFDLFSADASLMALLGTYALSGGPQPALAVLWPNESMPAGVTAYGVEVVIRRSPSTANRPWATGEQALNPTWRIYVTQWPLQASGDMNYEAVLERLIALLPGASWTDVTVPGVSTGLAQAVVRWSNPEVVLPAEV